MADVFTNMQTYIRISIFTVCLYKHVNSNVLFSERKRNNDCSLETSKDGKHAGIAHDVQAECKYNCNMKKYYYEISWKPPFFQQTNVSAYRIVIMYDITRWCFQIQNNVQHFKFNASIGFEYGKRIKYAVTPQPITRVGGKFSAELKKPGPCPVEPKLIPLPHKVIPIGSNFTFMCKFVENPVPNVTIYWSFTSDNVNCAKDRYSIHNNQYMEISRDKRALKIIEANTKHVGCYILTVENGVGGKHEEKGYIDLNMSINALIDLQRIKDSGHIKLWCVIVVVVVLVAFIIIVTFGVGIYVCFKKTKNFQLAPSHEEPVKKVYVSHCTEDEDDRTTLLKFASIIKSFNINVIIDLCSDVSINVDGGLSRWIRNNIKTADTIMVILTPSYLVALQAENNNYNENTCKVHLEYNFIDDMLFNNCQKSKHLIIISKDVEPNKFPSVFENKSFFKFPTKLNFGCDEDTDNNFHGIIGVILEKECLQLQVQNQTVGYQCISLKT